ncbi:MAG: type II toxin-antitoxin system HigB family toxin [Steroidobacteraceae bacterium]
MRIVGRNRLDAFCARYADARQWIEAWLHETESMSWTKPQDIKDRYAMASFLHGDVVIFNVRGNSYRLEVHVAFRSGIVTVLWVGTHREYDERNRRR